MEPVPGQPGMFMMDRPTLERLAERLADEKYYREEVLPQWSSQLDQCAADLEEVIGIAEKQGEQIRDLQEALWNNRVWTGLFFMGTITFATALFIQ